MPATRDLRLTPRDEALLADLGEVTVLSAGVIGPRYFPADRTGKSCLRRLRLLTRAGLVTPVAITACFGPAAGRHTVYRLTPRGADLLARRAGAAVRCLRTDPRPDTLVHRVLVARVVLAVADGAAGAGLPRPPWLLEHDRWPDARRDAPEPEQYRLAFDAAPIGAGPGRPAEGYGPPAYDDPAVRLVKARPDAACLLARPGEAAPVALLFEVDAGTETHGQVLSKLPGYHALLTRRGFDRPWRDRTDTPPGAARVLFVFPSAGRLGNVLDRLAARPTVLWPWADGYRPTAEDDRRAADFLERFVRFGVLAEVERPGCLGSPIWSTLRRRAAGERLAICPC
jgi:hypothetical protein